MGALYRRSVAECRRKRVRKKVQVADGLGERQGGCKATLHAAGAGARTWGGGRRARKKAEMEVVKERQ